MSNFFHIILTQPLLNALIWLYNVIPGHDMGVAIIALTLLLRLALYPTFQKQLRAQKDMQKLQPKLDELKARHKDDKEAHTRATLELYKEHKVSPLSSCLPLLIQLPILIALYRVFLSGLGGGDIARELYPFIQNPGPINVNFLGLINLAKPNIIFGILAGGFQFLQTKMMLPKKAAGTQSDATARIMNAQMTYFMPVITIIIAIRLPAGLSLYWVVTTLLAIAQQWYIMRGDDRTGFGNHQANTARPA